MNQQDYECENCGASPLKTFIDQPNFTLWHCDKCDLYQKGTPPREGVYEKRYHKCYLDRRDRKIITATIRLGSLAPYLEQPDPRMLDIGCSVGATVEAGRRLGWRSFGVDISAQAVKVCKEHGLDAFKIDGTELPFRDASFDIITNWHVIEHVTDINATLAEWFRVLRPGGVMIFEAPDAAYLKAQWLGARYKKFWPPEHLYAFRRSNMISLLTKAGFEILPYRVIGSWTTLPAHLTTYALAYRTLRWACRQVNLCKSLEICCRRPAQSTTREIHSAAIGKAA